MTRSARGLHQPAEWAAHRAVWVAWPSDVDLWGQALPDAQAAFVAMCRAIADPDPATGAPRGERLEVLVPDAAREDDAQAALAGLGARLHVIPFGDIWMRDIAPIFLSGDDGARAAARFAFNGWGGKYVLAGDDGVAAAVVEAAGVDARAWDLVLEGGSVEVDGEGTILTTTQCLLNDNRNPGVGREALEAFLCEALGGEKVLWLGDGLLNDHTDGHVDTIARFVAPGVVVCMAAQDADDPNREVLEAIARDLAAMTDARGRRLEVVRIPSPGRVLDVRGEIMPASYVNFYIGNRAVVVPVYGVASDAAALEAIGRLFPGRAVVGVDARAILEGGGAFHCITQQEPA
ncbi:MAG: agmatine deiminase family protein [Deltaproteobacteria bacterium]|nr:MAG: agmatine deiminase family protein [Deltaproteobacteria bacterium]